MSDECKKAYEEWSRKREARKLAEKEAEVLTGAAIALGATFGISAGIILGVAAVMTATAATGVGLPVAIAAGVVALGVAAFF